MKKPKQSPRTTEHMVERRKHRRRRFESKSSNHSQKGDSNKFENYRPIPLLNTLYKIFAAILQRRISRTLDRHLQKTQYGFRKDRSIADAIRLIRRVIAYGESTNNRLHLLPLDWEKAFDKVDREEMFNAMERVEINTKLINLVNTLYKTFSPK